MKKTLNFWQSLGKYAWKVAKRSPLPWPYVGLGVVAVVLLASLLNVKNSVAGAENIRQVIEGAASLGDYTTARNLWNNQSSITNNQILGAESEIEDKVYPERLVERRITELEEKLTEYPENKELYLELSRLHREIGSEEKAQEYFELARILDPNGEEFQ